MPKKQLRCVALRVTQISRNPSSNPRSSVACHQRRRIKDQGNVMGEHVAEGPLPRESLGVPGVPQSAMIGLPSILFASDDAHQVADRVNFATEIMPAPPLVKPVVPSKISLKRKGPIGGTSSLKGKKSLTDDSSEYKEYKERKKKILESTIIAPSLTATEISSSNGDGVRKIERPRRTARTPAPRKGSLWNNEHSFNQDSDSTTIPTLPSALDGEDDSGLLERSTNGAADASTLDETRHKRNKQRAYMHLTNELLLQQKDDNQSHCETCNGIGQLFCCDGCPCSFHALCLNPPLRNLPEDSSTWFCRSCAHKKKLATSKPVALGWDRFHLEELAQRCVNENPSIYQLPKEIRGYFKGVYTAEDGGYLDDPGVRGTKYDRQKSLEDRDPYKLLDKKGRPVLCYRCRGSAASLGADTADLSSKNLSNHSTGLPAGRPVISCDYCDLHWHFDCCDPPVLKMPAPHRKWMCQNHAAHVIPRENRIPKINPLSITVNRRGIRNNGNIDIIADYESSDLKPHARPPFGQLDCRQYRMTESIVRQDFLDGSCKKAAMKSSGLTPHIEAADTLMRLLNFGDRGEILRADETETVTTLQGQASNESSEDLTDDEDPLHDSKPMAISAQEIRQAREVLARLSDAEAIKLYAVQQLMLVRVFFRDFLAQSAHRVDQAKGESALLEFLCD